MRIIWQNQMVFNKVRAKRNGRKFGDEEAISIMGWISYIYKVSMIDV